MAELTPLEEVPKDFDPDEVMGVVNPTDEDFMVPFAGKPVFLKAGEHKIWPSPKANHVAKHLAQKILNDKNFEVLQKKFDGLDTEGREKWKVNTQITYTKKDIESIKEHLLYNAESGIPTNKVPETKFDKILKDKNKAGKKVDGKLEDADQESNAGESQEDTDEDSEDGAEEKPQKKQTKNKGTKSEE